jgi:putative N6-adenine-specific DNA methylase
VTSAPEIRGIVSTCAAGCAEALAGEIPSLGLVPDDISPAAVTAKGTWDDAMRLLVNLRTANRVLWPVGEFSGETSEDLYRGALAVPWEEWLPSGIPFHVHGASDAADVRDPRFAVLRVKDGVADRFRKKRGARPDAAKSAAGAVSVAFRQRAGKGTFFLDLAGESLSRRGWRRNGWLAPVKETLAAAVLRLAGWGEDGDDALASPMCGSGTFAVEAALAALRRAPGLSRGNPAVLRFALPDGMRRAYREAVAEAASRVREKRLWIAASDIAPEAVAAAEENARAAGVERYIRFFVSDLRKAPLPVPPGLVVVNPPYGERIGERKSLPALYRALGDDLKRRGSGLRAAVLSEDGPGALPIGLKPDRKIPLKNGDIPCVLSLYSLYRGTRDARLIAKRGRFAK